MELQNNTFNCRTSHKFSNVSGNYQRILIFVFYFLLIITNLFVNQSCIYNKCTFWKIRADSCFSDYSLHFRDNIKYFRQFEDNYGTIIKSLNTHLYRDSIYSLFNYDSSLCKRLVSFYSINNIEYMYRDTSTNKIIFIFEDQLNNKYNKNEGYCLFFNYYLIFSKDPFVLNTKDTQHQIAIGRYSKLYRLSEFWYLDTYVAH